ncbi:hypothetical protein F4801DRAFT_570079 [Xylaria longipes]|nr:hypothetical protein F4801DRAFT_570079 [Xylaria longipes]
MKITLAIIAFATVASAQSWSDIPACAQPCILSAAATTTDCADTDYACICELDTRWEHTSRDMYYKVTTLGSSRVGRGFLSPQIRFMSKADNFSPGASQDVVEPAAEECVVAACGEEVADAEVVPAVAALCDSIFHC